MYLNQLKLAGFRNYRELDLIPGERINILHGSNAQGKTSILEAISLIATTRSLRAGRESEVIFRDMDEARITAEVKREREGDAELQVSVFQSDKKAVRVNGLKKGRVIDLLGEFNAIFFGSIDLSIVTADPSVRRHYLNVEISQISPRYVYDLGHYKRILEQRNRLLRDLRERPRSLDESGLNIWNQQLVKFGAPLFEKRRFYLNRLAPLADRIHRQLTDGKEGLEIRYLPSITLPENKVDTVSNSERIRETAEDVYVSEVSKDITVTDKDYTDKKTDGDTGADALVKRRGSRSEASSPSLTQDNIIAKIAESFSRRLDTIAGDEMRRGTTLAGPQRDDITFLIDGADARVYGSQGQQRTAVLALKLAEFQLIEDYVGEAPVLLLDDVMSDLDDVRRKHLLNWIQNRGQIFISCTNLRSFPSSILQEATTFHVVAGTVTQDGIRTSEARETATSITASPE